jgi:flagellar FliL protein
LSSPAPVPAPAPASKKGLFLGLAAILISLGSSGFAWYTLKGSVEKPAEKPPAVTSYVKLEPTFVVNLADFPQAGYLQADVEISTRDAETLKALEMHLPAVRNRILMLLSQQTSEKLQGRAQKEGLQKLALAEVQSVLKAHKAASSVDAVIFTSLVTQ